MQRSMTASLALVSLSLLWWSGVVFLRRGDYLDVPKPSIVLLLAAMAMAIYSLKGTGEKDRIERYLFRPEEL